MLFDFQPLTTGVLRAGDIIERPDGKRFFNPWTDYYDVILVDKLLADGLKVWRIDPTEMDTLLAGGMKGCRINSTETNT